MDNYVSLKIRGIGNNGEQLVSVDDVQFYVGQMVSQYDSKINELEKYKAFVHEKLFSFAVQNEYVTGEHIQGMIDEFDGEVSEERDENENKGEDPNKIKKRKSTSGSSKSKEGRQKEYFGSIYTTKV